MTYEISRRSLLRGGFGVAAAGLLTGLPSTALAAPKPSGGGTLTDAQIYGVPTINPLVERRADPFITRPVDGMYYFTGSVPE